jgi:hypothetical protein
MDGVISYDCSYGCNCYQGGGAVSYLLECISRRGIAIRQSNGRT